MKHDGQHTFPIVDGRILCEQHGLSNTFCAVLSSRERTEAPRFLVSLAMGGERLQIRADYGADPPCIRRPGDLGWRGSTLAQGFPHSFERDGQTDLAAMPETVGYGLRYTEHLDRDAFNCMRLDAVCREIVREAQHADQHVTQSPTHVKEAPPLDAAIASRPFPGR